LPLKFDSRLPLVRQRPVLCFSASHQLTSYELHDRLLLAEKNHMKIHVHDAQSYRKLLRQSISGRDFFRPTAGKQKTNYFQVRKSQQGRKQA